VHLTRTRAARSRASGTSAATLIDPAIADNHGRIARASTDLLSRQLAAQGA
jgi:hypothetical protein